MESITFSESEITLENGKLGKMVIFRYVGAKDPVFKLNEAVNKYVGNMSYTEFVDANMDNPWVRVIVIGINELELEEFEPEKHRASA